MLTRKGRACFWSSPRQPSTCIKLGLQPTPSSPWRGGWVPAHCWASRHVVGLRIPSRVALGGARSCQFLPLAYQRVNPCQFLPSVYQRVNPCQFLPLVDQRVNPCQFLPSVPKGSVGAVLYEPTPSWVGLSVRGCALRAGAMSREPTPYQACEAYQPFSWAPWGGG